MKVTVEKVGMRYQVCIQQGHQQFSLNYISNKRDCEWLAKMFRHAFKKHDQEIGKKKRKK